MQLELKIGKTSFIVKESLRVEVVFRNGGSATVSVPEIANIHNRVLNYYLTGPSIEKELAFQYGKPAAAHVPDEATLVPVAPGSELAEAITLEKRVKEWKPGAYTLRATLDAGKQKLQSNVVAFEILEPEVKSGQVILDSVSSSEPFMRVLFEAAAQGTSRLYQGFFGESRPGLETAPTVRFSEVMALPSGASDVATLWADFDRSMVSPRYIWLNGHTVSLQEFQAQPITFDLGNEKLLRPGLMSRDAGALLVSWNGSHVTLTRVPRKGPAAKAWEVTLPLPASAGRVWQTSTAKVTVVFAAQQENVVSLFLVEEGKLIAKTEIDKAILLPNSEPGLAIASDGTVRASVLVAAPDQPRSISIADWKWSRSEPNSEAKRQLAINLAQDPKTSAVVYAFGPGVPRRDWVIVYGGDIVVTSGSPTRPRMLPGAPVLPLALLPRPQMSYLLLKDAKDVVNMAPMY
jgi:hypothetical protein